MSQIILRGPDGNYFVDQQVIVDQPKYAYRGFMIDTARHFIPVSTIKKVVDGMAIEKLNTLHWHAVDDQSFPIEVQSLPRLAKAAAFGPGLTYSKSNISHIHLALLSSNHP